MKRIMLYVLFFLVYGIIAAAYTNGAVMAAFFVLPVVVCFLLYFRFKKRWIFAFLAVTAAGTVFCCCQKNKINDFPENGDAVVKGYVRQIKRTSWGEMYYVISAEETEIGQDIYNKRVKLIFYSENNEKLNVSQRVVIRGDLFKIGKKTNPYAFNAYNYYMARGIYFKMYGEVSEYGGQIKSLGLYFDELRQALSSVYDKILPRDAAEFAKAVVLGERDYIEEYQKDKLSRVGVYHIVAVSGLHVSIICMFVVFITDRIHIRWGKIAAVIIIILYAIFTGGSPSAIRAALMASVVLLRYIFKRSSDFLTSICFSAVVILLLRPFMLFDIGFQYSFGAVFTIGFIVRSLNKIIEKNYKGKVQRFIKYVVFCLSLSLLLKIITAYYFYGVSNVDFIANIILLPFLSIAVISAFLGGFVGLFWIGAAKAVVSVFYLFWLALDTLSSILVALPYSYTITGRLAVYVVVGFLIFFVLTAFAFYDRHTEKRKYLILIGFGIFALSALFDITVRNSERLTLTFLDVGQGESAYGEYKNFCFLIDGGGNFFNGEERDAGYNVIKPHLKGRGRKRINAVFISHTDADHAKGIIEAMDFIKIDAIYMSAANPSNEYYEKVITKAADKNIAVYEMKDGDYIGFKKLRISCIYPFGYEKNDDINNSSMVLRVDYGLNSVLFTGDIEKEAETEILNNSKNIECDIIKIAHHGSNTSTSQEFIEKVGAEYAVISAGKNNIYSHPSEDVLNRIEDGGKKVFITFKDGAVTAVFNTKNYKIKSIVC